jgi:hypothetical protein
MPNPFDQQTWDMWERTTYAGHVIYLYKISILGIFTENHVRYCTGANSVTFNDEVYVPYPCVHSEIKKSIDDEETTVKFAGSKMWITVLLEHTPHRVNVEIYRYKTDLNMANMIYSGDMKKTTLNENIFTLELGSSYAAGKTDLICYYTQRHCNHAPYQYFCGLNFDDWKIRIGWGEWWLNGSKNVILPASFTLDSEYWRECVLLYQSLFIEDGQEYFFELDNVAVSAGGRVITTKYPVSCDVDPSQSALYFAPNCILSLKRCRDIFGNLAHSCGWPDMPLKNYASIDNVNSQYHAGKPLGPPSYGFRHPDADAQKGLWYHNDKEIYKAKELEIVHKALTGKDKPKTEPDPEWPDVWEES